MFEKNSRTTLTILFNCKVERELYGHYTALGNLIDQDAVESLGTAFGYRIVLKPNAELDKNLVQATNTKEWCVKIHYTASGRGHRAEMLIPINVIDHIEEQAVSVLKPRVPEARSPLGPCGDSCSHGHPH